MSPPHTQRPASVAVLLALAATLVAGCGKKGPPLPPLLRIPVAPPDLAVSRIDEDVYVRFAVPAVNVDGIGPADVALVELYAVTTDTPPPASVDPETLREVATLVGREVVRRPLPPLPPLPDGQPAPPMPPPEPGVDQGTTVVFRERLTPETRTPIAIPDESAPAPSPRTDVDVPRPLVAPPASGGPQRYYFAVGVSARGRYGPPTGLVPAPLGPTSGPPGAPTIEVEESRMVLVWEPPPDARTDPAATAPDLLPSRPIVPGPPPTTYDVYEVPPEASAEAPLAVPVAITPAPLATPELTQSGITLGAERCFIVRPVDIVSGIHVRGPASPMVCASFADTFAPAPPTSLESIATAGVISLLWEGSEAKDLAGYLVLRGEPGSATLTPLTAEPIRPTTYRDDSVRPGQTYVYAVMAVDTAGNRSAESNRVEDTARQ